MSIENIANLPSFVYYKYKILHAFECCSLRFRIIFKFKTKPSTFYLLYLQL